MRLARCVAGNTPTATGTPPETAQARPGPRAEPARPHLTGPAGPSELLPGEGNEGKPRPHRDLSPRVQLRGGGGWGVDWAAEATGGRQALPPPHSPSAQQPRSAPQPARRLTSDWDRAAARTAGYSPPHADEPPSSRPPLVGSAPLRFTIGRPGLSPLSHWLFAPRARGGLACVRYVPRRPCRLCRSPRGKSRWGGGAEPRAPPPRRVLRGERAVLREGGTALRRFLLAGQTPEPATAGGGLFCWPVRTKKTGLWCAGEILGVHGVCTSLCEHRHGPVGRERRNGVWSLPLKLEAEP